MEKWFILQKHPDDHMLSVRETFVDDSRPIRYVIWHRTGIRPSEPEGDENDG